ncbi:MAG: hypothetical protein SGJ27_21740 [Candidatus Melainabacteria bacterium]|nr:hypothetical protein [Candidatus Melainabacteria bacterium]
MFRIKTLVFLIALLSLVPGKGLAYGVTIKSAHGISMDGRMQDFEGSVLDAVAAAAKGLPIPPDSRFELVVGADGKAKSAVFLNTTAGESVTKGLIEKLEAQTYGTLPGLDGDGTLALSFTFAEINSPPFKRNSIKISGGGGARITGGMTISGGDGDSAPFSARGFENQRQALDAQKLSTAQEKEDNVRANLRLARTALGPNLDGTSTISAAAVRIASQPEQRANAEKCYLAAVKTLDTMPVDARGRLVTDFATLSSRLVLANMTDTADSAIRKAIEIEESTNKGANQFSPRIIDKAVTRVVQQYRGSKQYQKAISLLQYRIDKFKSAATIDPNSVSRFQNDLNMLTALSSGKARPSSPAPSVSQDSLDDISKKFGQKSIEYRFAVMKRVKELKDAGKTAEAMDLMNTLKF